MAEVKVTDPEEMGKKKVDSSGKIYLGRNISGKQVKFIIEEVREMPDDE